MHNNYNTLSNSIESILNQSYDNIEIIIVDEYSTDGSQELLKDLCGNNIKSYLQRENKGFYHGCNFGLSKSTGDFIFYFDLNSKWDPRYIEIMVSIFTLVNVDVLYSGELIYKNHDSEPFCVKFNGNNFIDLRNCCHKNQIINDLNDLDNFNALSVPITCINKYVNNEVFFDFEIEFKNNLIESNAINIMLQNEYLSQNIIKKKLFDKFSEIVYKFQQLKIKNTFLIEDNISLQTWNNDLKEKMANIESANSNLKHKMDSYKYELTNLKEDKLRLIDENKTFLEDISNLRNKIADLESEEPKIKLDENNTVKLIEKNKELSNQIINLKKELDDVNSDYSNLKQRFRTLNSNQIKLKGKLRNIAIINSKK